MCFVLEHPTGRGTTYYFSRHSKPKFPPGAIAHIEYPTLFNEVCESKGYYGIVEMTLQN